MASAVLKNEQENTVVSIDVHEGLSAALVRATSIAEAGSILDSISKEDWQSMDESESCILVFDTDSE